MASICFDAIAQLMEKFAEVIRKKLPKVYSKDLVEVLFTQPYCRVSSLVNAGIAERQTASEYLKKIEKLSLIESTKMGRDVVYLNLKLFKILCQ